MTDEVVLCPKCKHAVSEHYAGCMVQDEYDGWCDCDEQFNLATKVRYPNRTELIEMLEQAAERLEQLKVCAEDWYHDPLAEEIKRRLAGVLEEPCN